MHAQTPGPWAWDDNGVDLRGPQGQMVLSVGEPQEGPSEADAAVIAAAPELLAALKALRDGAYGNPSYPVENDQIDEAADAAIAKAEGNS